MDMINSTKCSQHFHPKNFIASAIEPSPEGLPFAKAGPLVTDGNDLGQLCIAGIAHIQALCLWDDRSAKTQIQKLFPQNIELKTEFQHWLLHFCSSLTHVMVLNGMLLFLSFKRSSAILWLSTGPRWNQLKSTVEKGIGSHADHENPSIATSLAALFYNWHGRKNRKNTHSSNEFIWTHYCIMKRTL